MTNGLLLFLGGPEAGGDPTMSFVFLGAIFFVFYFFIIRPQSQRQKEVQNKIAGIKKGDKVVTSGGIVGNVTGLDDEAVTLEVASNVKIKFMKNAVVDVNPTKDQGKKK